MPAETPRTSARRFSADALHIVGLSNLAIAQPLYDLLGRHPEFFIARGASRLDLVVCIGLLTLAVPGVLVATEAIAALAGRRARLALHWVIVTALIASIALPLLTRFGLLADPARVATAIVLGIAACTSLERLRRLREFASLLAIGALLSPAFFAAAAPVRSVFFPAARADFAPVAATHPVVLVVFDELGLPMLLNESGTIDGERYPGFARLAARSTWYPNAFASTDYTIHAVPGLLGGLYPNPGLHPTPSDYPDNLFTRMAGSWELNVHESVTMLCPPTLCPRAQTPLPDRIAGMASDLSIIFGHFVLPTSLTQRLPPISDNWAYFAGKQLPWKERWDAGNHADREAQFDRFIDGLRRGSRPTLHFLHTLLPHAPYEYLPSGRRYGDRLRTVGTITEDQWSEDEWAITQTLQQHLLQLGFVDRLVGRLLDRLQDQHLLDDALLIVTADHGISFEPGEPRRRLTRRNALEIGSIPLFVKLPGQVGGGIDERLVQTIDLPPSISDWLEFEIPWKMDGRSLAGNGGPIRRTIQIRPSHEENQRVRLSEDELTGENRLDKRVRALRLVGGERSLTSVAAYPDLVGQPVESLRIVKNPDLGLTAHVHAASGPIRRTPEFAPIHVSGVLRGAEGPEPHHLAIAVDGVVRAVTQTFDASHAGRSSFWAALIAESDLDSDGNGLVAYWIRPIGDGIELHHAGTASAATYSLGVAKRADVEESGFWSTEVWNMLPVRWTRGHAILELPPSDEPPPIAIELELMHTGPDGNQLEVLVNDRVVFDATLTPAPWQARIELVGVDASDGLRIELKSGTFAPVSPDADPADPVDPRDLGVAISRLELIR